MTDLHTKETMPVYSEREKEILRHPDLLIGKEWITTENPPRKLKIVKRSSFVEGFFSVLIVDHYREVIDWMLGKGSEFDGAFSSIPFCIAPGFEILFEKSEPSSCSLNHDTIDKNESSQESLIRKSNVVVYSESDGYDFEKMDEYVENLKKEYKHSLVSIGFVSGQFAIMDTLCSEAFRKLESFIDPDTFREYRNNIYIIGFDDFFEIYDLQ